MRGFGLCLIAVCVFFACGCRGADPIETQVLESFLKGLSNGDVLGWGGGGDACGWKHIRCRGQSITGIGVENLGLRGTLTPDLNKLTNLEYLGLQFNSFSGPLPSFSGLKNLQTVYLNSNSFSTIPSDFFHGLENLQHIYLDHNLLNTSSGWELPLDVQSSTRLVNLSLTNTSLTGEIPGFLGKMASLRVLNLAYNSLKGGLPDSFAGSGLTQLQVNNMALGGPIDVVGSMASLSQLWLQVNQFSGTVPSGLSEAVSLRDLRLNNNKLKGLLPNLTSLPLSQVNFASNSFMGPIPAIPGAGADAFSGNKFCQSIPGRECTPQVSSVLGFLEGIGFPDSLIGSWAGTDVCTGLIGVSCDGQGVVVGLNIPSSQLKGTISPAIGGLTSLRSIILSNNNLSGSIPPEIGTLPALEKLDLSNNNLHGPMIKFSHNLTVNVAGNPLLNSAPAPGASLSPGNSPNPSPGTDQPSPSGSLSPPAGPGIDQPSPGRNGSSEVASPPPSKKSIPTAVEVAVPVAGALSLLSLLVIFFFLCCRKKGKGMRSSRSGSSGMLVHPRNSTSEPEPVKLSISRGEGLSSSSNKNNSGPSGLSGPNGDVHVVEAGNLVISIQVLRQATRNFNQETVLGRGGFGVVYKGVLDDGTTIAVKRMEASTVVSSKGLSEFQAEIAVLTKVRHRHLVALLGYCIEGNEKLLVYEFLPNGTLAQHLFEEQGKKSFDWKRRLVIALDVARGMEYLHGLAHMSFIHRDLKPSNILLDDDFRAKVSDFGLVKLAPEGKFSVETRLAGTFGYLAPEYAVTGRVTTKADVFSFGVVLMELITGRRALDETQAEENMHLVTWFRRRNVSREAFGQVIDPGLEASEEELESMYRVAELAKHCTAREPYNRPDMGHAVNVLAPLVDLWKPTDLEGEESKGIDLNLTLPQALKQWQASDDTTVSGSSLYDSQSSLPTRPVGFADSFTSSDAR